MLGPHSAAPG
uniref:Uncharacterized protein n=1 Tax=Anguilla anguilla TaxID=7936 RepID=A0A0E9SJ67_ANGAN